MLQRFIQQASSNPKGLFLVDGIGALVSAILLGLVLPYVQPYIGLPTEVLYFLAVFPVLFFLYDLGCYLRLRQKWAPYIRGIAYANLAYVILSILSLIYHYPQLTYLGLAYFIGEIILVLILVRIELGTVKMLTQKG